MYLTAVRSLCDPAPSTCLNFEHFQHVHSLFNLYHSYRFAIVFFSDKSPSNQLNMVLATKARRLREIGSTADIILAVPWDAQIYAQIDGIRIVTLEPPFMDDNVPLMSRVAIQSRKNCCGLREFYKLQVWAMTEYDKIILIDTDQALIRNFDRLFGCDVQFAFTSGTAHPLDAGMLLIKPDAIVRDYLVMSFLDAKSWSDETGWFGKVRSSRPLPAPICIHPSIPSFPDSLVTLQDHPLSPRRVVCLFRTRIQKQKVNIVCACPFEKHNPHVDTGPRVRHQPQGNAYGPEPPAPLSGLRGRQMALGLVRVAPGAPLGVLQL